MYYLVFKNLLNKITSKCQIFLASISQKSMLALKKYGVRFNGTSLLIWIFSSSAELFTPTAGKPCK